MSQGLSVTCPTSLMGTPRAANAAWALLAARRNSLMPSANLDLARSICLPWERGDFSSAAWAHPEIEFVQSDGPAPGSSTGLDGLARRWREFLSAWEMFRVEADERHELDDERVLVLVHFSGRGKASGLEVEQMLAKGACLFHVGYGRITKLAIYWNRERALADLGLAPATLQSDRRKP